ncbi:Zn-dependent protease [Clostridium carboxidivorans P7]|uniref:Peptidase U62 modulator of DNA gyrase n=1 Tax=Clostridium carboxidivorans P7 TaxID=536227 RepID=C6PWF4_9CLOT|nr:TldD/PmbA family protein [Clostridium carboxidivorans]AKN30518.1 Zn-dependent protease [Clostridium carboxidivorans P7]EET86431.1 peptidase U62 modulator of DNA gyrase [Clostridium carboxidivorans P7]EFG86260.1 TldD/PmbA family protein [Clostridium carboxidivorans P7]
MKVKMSNFLNNTKPSIKKLIKNLSKDFKYVSVLGSDVCGKLYSVQRTGISIQDSFWSERGFVVKVYNGISYSEISFNEINENEIESISENIRKKVKGQIQSLKNKVNINAYDLINEEKIEKTFIGEVKVLPEQISDKEIVEKMISIKDKAFSLSDFLIDLRVRYQQVHVSKIFISNNKDLAQSYIWSEGSIFSIVRRENKTKYSYSPFSGLKASELLEEISEKVDETVDISIKLLDSKPVTPGEYECICSPDVSGIIAHEAFGHGVEMDMFVKNRAKAAEYMDKEIASPLVTMHDGAASAVDVSSYLFDDEGVLGTDTVVIDKGILKKGISDTLSALKLATTPTGNGKRQSFERKAYSRMTNTYFAAGSSKLEDMIASIEFGYLLDCPMSGMEDPKNWGIQCMVNYGLEIKNGKLTGNIVSPVVLTGYVPDLLKSISMVSDKVELCGSGACGKGYKEFVKVSSGGPYIKAKVRLG